MPEAGLDEWTSWRCARNIAKFCPEEGCPAHYGCARDHGWTPEMPTPPECLGKDKPRSRSVLYEPLRDELIAAIRDMKDESEISCLIDQLIQAAFKMGWEAAAEAYY